MEKYSLGIIVISVSLLMTFVLMRQITVRIDLNNVFKSDPKVPPPIAIKLQGVDGDSAIVGFGPTDASEEIVMSGQNLNMAKKYLSEIQTGQLEAMSNLPQSFFKYNLYINYNGNTENNPNKLAAFEVLFGDRQYKVLPDKYLTLTRNQSIDEISDEIASIKIRLSYTDGFYNAFYDKNGDFVSQLAGQIIIKPVWWVYLMSFLGIWAFFVAIIVLFKQTLFLTKDVLEAVEYIKSP